MDPMRSGTGARCAQFIWMIPLLALVACAGPLGGAPDPELANAPGWVVRGCAGSYERICGVGVASGVQDPALRRTAAIGRARTEIARNLQVRVVALLKDYASSADGSDTFREPPHDEQHIVDVSKQITNLTLAGSEVIDTWISPSASYYALVALDVDKFTGTVSRMNQLSATLRDAVVARASDAFAELDVEP